MKGSSAIVISSLSVEWTLLQFYVCRNVNNIRSRLKCTYVICPFQTWTYELETDNSLGKCPFCIYRER